MPTKYETGIQKAISIAGTQKKLAEMLRDFGVRVSHQAVQKWAAKGRVPPAKVAAVSAVTNVERAELNPLIFGEPAVSSSLSKKQANSSSLTKNEQVAEAAK